MSSSTDSAGHPNRTPRAKAELALMKELVPLLIKRAQGRDISGLSAYDQ